MEKASILIVDDDRAILQTPNAILESRGAIPPTQLRLHVCEKEGLMFFRKRK